MKSTPKSLRKNAIKQGFLNAEAHLPPKKIYAAINWTRDSYHTFKRTLHVNIEKLDTAEQWLKENDYWPQEPPTHVREKHTTYNETKTTICPHCLTAIPVIKNAKYCPHCGKEITS